MIATTFLKCLLLAKAQVLIVEQPIDEYAMASIQKVFNGIHFEATVIEGRMNSVSMESINKDFKTMSYSPRDYEQKALTTKADFKGKSVSLDCEIADR